MSTQALFYDDTVLAQELLQLSHERVSYNAFGAKTAVFLDQDLSLIHI